MDDTSVKPVITLNASTDNSNCSGAAPNGSLTINVDGIAPGAGHTIQWYTGIGTGSILAGETAATIFNLAAGDYTVEVIDIASPGNTCSSVATFTVVDDLPVYTINAAEGACREKRGGAHWAESGTHKVRHLVHENRVRRQPT